MAGEDVPPDGDGTSGPEQLPRLPGFREMALRRMAQAERRLVGELAEERQAAGLSQTEVAARMGTSQSAVARLEAGEADTRASTLERYAAAIGSEMDWQLEGSGTTGREEGERSVTRRLVPAPAGDPPRPGRRSTPPGSPASPPQPGHPGQPGGARAVAGPALRAAV